MLYKEHVKKWWLKEMEKLFFWQRPPSDNKEGSFESVLMVAQEQSQRGIPKDYSLQAIHIRIITRRKGYLEDNLDI